MYRAITEMLILSLSAIKCRFGNKINKQDRRLKRKAAKENAHFEKKNNYLKIICLLFICACIITGCANHSAEGEISAENRNEESEKANQAKPEDKPNSNYVETGEEISADNGQNEPETVEADWSEYFNGLNGTAVVYEPADRRYTIYNQALAETRRPPCSTFKIISSLIALENGIIEPEDSTRTWSGEVFWNESWNKDINFSEAFRTSCVWYFRQVIDDIGKDMMQNELDKLRYGNCDISD